MEDDKVISIQGFKECSPTISLRESLEEDINTGVITPTLAKQLSVSEISDIPEYAIEIRKVGNQIVADLPESVRKRKAERAAIEDYLTVTDTRAMELL